MEELRAAERRLQDAQRANDADALDELLHDRLVAIGPDGARYSKDDDLTAYRSGTSVITAITEEDLALVEAGTTGVTFFTGTVTGTFNGQPLTARLRYTRTWTHDPDVGWQVLAAHISPAQGS